MTQPATTSPAPTTQIPSAFKLLDRSCVLTVGSVIISNIGQKTGLDIWFSVKRSLKPRTPNTADIKIYNLSDATRKAIEQSAQPLPPPGGSAPTATRTSGKGKNATTTADNTGTPVTILAGYVGAQSLIFQGALRAAQTMTDGATTTTELTSGEGDSAAILARTTFSFGKGASAYTVALQLLKDMGSGVGNIATVINALKGSAYGTNGVVLKGSSFEILSDLAKSCGLEVTLQKGVAQWLPLGQPLAGTAYLFQTAPTNTGVIGSPSVDTKGVLSIDVEMVPGIAPGVSIVVQTAYLSGLYRVTSVETIGDTSGNDWKHRIEAQRLGNAP